MSLSKQLCKQHKQLTMKTRRRYLMRYNFSIALCVCVCVWVFVPNLNLHVHVVCRFSQRLYDVKNDVMLQERHNNNINNNNNGAEQADRVAESQSSPVQMSRCAFIMLTLFVCMCVCARKCCSVCGHEISCQSHVAHMFAPYTMPNGYPVK